MVTDSLRRVADLRERVSRIQRDVDRATGALENTVARIKKEFDCNNLEDARGKLEDLRKKEKEVTERLAKSIDEFEKKWQSLLDTQ